MSQADTAQNIHCWMNNCYDLHDFPIKGGDDDLIYFEDGEYSESDGVSDNISCFGGGILEPINLENNVLEPVNLENNVLESVNLENNVLESVNLENNVLELIDDSESSEDSTSSSEDDLVDFGNVVGAAEFMKSIENI